jgi:hypothetical protein
MRVQCFPAAAGNRALFLVEVTGRREARRIRELFEMVAQLAEVQPISQGAITSYAVIVPDDPSLIGKVEWLLKTEFGFSMVERTFSAVTFNLINDLCQNAEATVIDLPECGICETVDPFPVRAMLEISGRSEPLEAAYCARCAQAAGVEETTELVRRLVQRDRRGYRLVAETQVTTAPDVAANEDWEQLRLALAG